MAAELTAKEMVRNYVRLRDHKKAADTEFKKSMERVNEGMRKLEGMMLAHLNDTGAKNIATDEGTVYKNTKYSATVRDRDTFLTHCRETEEWDALDVRANKTYVREQADDGNVIPGVELSSIVTVGVRRS